MGARLMDAIAWAHALRVLSFMTTVVPNPHPDCYLKNFPPVPPGASLSLACGAVRRRLLQPGLAAFWRSDI